MKSLSLTIALLLASTHGFAMKPCEELKTEIAAKIDANKVVGYALDIVAMEKAGEEKAADVKGTDAKPAVEGKVVGTCEGGTKKIVYTRK